MKGDPVVDATTHDDAPARRDRLVRSRWAAVGAAVAVTFGAGAGLGLVAATDGTPSSFVSVSPQRVLDTRIGLGLSGPFTSAEGRDLQVTGSVATPAGSQVVVPPGATAVSLNVTAVQPAAAGFVSVRPAGSSGAPDTSNLNFEAGAIVPNAVTVALPSSGAIELTYDAFGQPGPTTELLVDVMGFFVAGGGGEAGPPGPQGPAGPQGEPGPGALWAKVSTDGSAATLRDGNGVSSVLRAAEGVYRVDFDRSVRPCARVATLNGYGLGFGGTEGGYATVHDDAIILGTPDPQRLWVTRYDAAGAPSDGDGVLLDGFDLMVICP